MTEKLQVAMVIERPDDEELLAKLQKKLEDYLIRMGEYTHPELQLLQKPDAYFKHCILKTVLESGQVEYEAVVKEISDKFPDAFEKGRTYFPNAWEVIRLYAADRGKETINSTTGKPGLA